MYLLRHGQSFFNLHFTATKRDPGIEDPELTPLGHEQAEAAAVKLAGKGITRIIVSPLTRALQTAEPLRRMQGQPTEVMHEVRERYAFACDVGRHRDLLAVDFPEHDFAHLEERWWPHAHETGEAVVARANAFREAMAARADHATTLLVSHWGFLLALTGESLENGEVRSFDPTHPAPEAVYWG